MASMRGIKRRKESVQSTQQITKAMKLVATVKLQKARGKAEKNRPYFNMLYRTIRSILTKVGASDINYLNSNGSNKKAVIVVSGNRGLAGGYNSGLVKLIEENEQGLPKEDVLVYGIGRKAIESLSRKGYEIKKDYSDVINSPLYQDAIDLTKELLEEFDAGNIGEIYLAYTDFKNTVVHEPVMLKLLPLSEEDFAEELEAESAEVGSGKEAIMDFEPSEEEVLNMIIPKYLTNIIFGSYLSAIASENASRMQAMDSATSNAEEMIDKLSLQYNRARQSSITQELTEIIAGSEALN